jgi:alpha-amylase
MKLFLSLLSAMLLATAVSMFGTGAGVMMQGFYWNVPSPWYPTMQAQASALANMAGGYGIDRIWFPPAYKGQSGGCSMGYDPHDYYDLGSYYQDGTTNTRFGSQTQLAAAITAFNKAGIGCMEDIVLNHRSGGNNEYNPNTGGSNWTAFNNTASGMCQWHYNEFHPSTVEAYDEGTFGGYPDVCHATGNSPGHAYYDLIQWGKWLQTNVGFNGGWRFDYCKGYHAWMTHDFIVNTGSPFSVAEYWDSVANINTWVNNASGVCSAFDFPLMYLMATTCNDTTGNSGNMASWVSSGQSWAATWPMKAVTFVGNQDTAPIVSDSMLAYAFILTYQGYPCIFWQDYFNYGLATGGGIGSAGWGNGINQLVWCRGRFVNGSPSIQILNQDNKVLVYGAYGSSSSAPGYIVIINENGSSYPNWCGVTVTTGNGYLKNQTLKAYAWSSTISGQNCAPNNVYCNGNGTVTVWAPARGYAVYSVNGF